MFHSTGCSRQQSLVMWVTPRFFEAGCKFATRLGIRAPSGIWKGRELNPGAPRESAARERLCRHAVPHEAIDLSDIPEVSDWSKAVVGKFYRPIKRSVTIRLDADVLAWLKPQGRGCQTRINRVLRDSMEKRSRR